MIFPMMDKGNMGLISNCERIEKELKQTKHLAYNYLFDISFSFLAGLKNASILYKNIFYHLPNVKKVTMLWFYRKQLMLFHAWFQLPCVQLRQIGL
jgi:hypothetical protein